MPGAEAGGVLGDGEAAGDVGVGRAGGEAGEGEGEAGGAGEAEGGAGGVAAVEEGVEEAGEPVEGGGGHAEAQPVLVRAGARAAGARSDQTPTPWFLILLVFLLPLSLVGAREERGGDGDLGGGEEMEEEREKLGLRIAGFGGERRREEEGGEGLGEERGHKG